MATSKRDEVMQQIKQDHQLLVMQDLVRHLSRKCFDRCISSPGTTFSKSEQTCLIKCADRFLESTQIVGKTYIDAAKKEKENA